MVKKQGDLSADIQQAFAENLYENSKQLHALLENLLEWARSQTGSIKLNKKPVVIHEMLQTTIHQAITNAQLKNINIELKGNKQIRAFADEDTLKTVLRNLISNAIKFSKPDSSIEISIHQKESTVSITITDTGIGMDDEQLKKLFKIEHSVTRVGTANEKGTGLGLVLCKEFIELNKGSITVDSEINKGSTFTITLPLDTTENSTPN